MTFVVHDTGWFKSTRSAGASEGCVEVRITDRFVGVRDSKDPTGPAFSFAPEQWHAFVGSVTPGAPA
ncbi:uncharacterized protein DUF397 [Herbihabitans rhizosphaerae]|uniref:Uncharacterized protein DUF397 n=1 Tax=Herbihabitans rhizosphaerae TaxID=1872711 RepID=A0A4Q7L2B1_9PSEU|nr:DUF397 domain-containing protein [Herbihabitans rhizosphaerae]RZS43347.1 uncharacterized protein DUF397 [Herbihabitans rhizosphaerae]